MVEMAVESHGASLLLSWHETCLGSAFGLRLAIGRARASARASHSLREFDSLFLSVKTKIGLSAYFYFHGGAEHAISEHEIVAVFCPEMLKVKTIRLPLSPSS